MSSANPRRKLAHFSFWAAAIAGFTFALVPDGPELPGSPGDKVQHALGFLVLTALAVWAYPRVSTVRIIIALSAFGALIELAQALPFFHRDSDVLDWVADTVAVLVGALAVEMWRRWKARR